MESQNHKKKSDNILNIDGTGYKTKLTEKFLQRKSWKLPDDKLIRSFIPGTIIKVYVKKGQPVKKGDKLLVLEAMKMKNRLLVPHAGKVRTVYIKEGETVAKDQLLIKMDYTEK